MAWRAIGVGVCEEMLCLIQREKKQQRNRRAMKLLSRNPRLLASEVWLLILLPT